MEVVEFMQEHTVLGRRIAAGARLLAWQSGGAWRVLFNGAEVLVPAGTVGALGSAEVKKAAEQRLSAREEEYQTAVNSSKSK
jgi:hypothetical protein